MRYVGFVLCTVFSVGCTLPLGTLSSSSGSALSTAVLTPLGNLPENVENAIGSVLKPKTLTPGFPDSGRKMAILEQKHLEIIPIKIDDKYGNLQEFVAGFYNPKPIVDTIQEHEKYGNDGDQFRKAANVLIAGVEGLSNVLNTAVELPFAAFRQVGKKITASLNTVGGKLVGLS